ncbi:MAG: sigma-70 family RNA polymerase sigma factor [Planctomycetia bacterium]|nr:sigma-70 family RNA polymerase sigma factor [Planctomycetia bacterium]
MGHEPEVDAETSGGTPVSDGISAETAELWVNEHLEPLYRYAYRMCGSASDAEDLVQETFLAAVRYGGKLRSGESATVRSWLYTTLRRKFWRRSRTGAAAAGVVELLVDDPEIWPEQSSEPVDDYGISSQMLQRGLDAMPPEYRVPLLMFSMQELSYREIADQLGVPIGTVMSRLNRARTLLRRKLELLKRDENRRTDVG